MKFRKLLVVLIAAAMMFTFMPAMAFAEDAGQLSKQAGEAPAAGDWETGRSGQSATWTRISTKTDGFWYYAIKAFWKSPDGTQTAASSDFYPADILDKDGYCTVSNVTAEKYYFGEFFENYGPGTYSFKIKTVYHSSSEYEDSQLSESQEYSFRGAKVTIKTFDESGAETSREGGDVMFSMGVGLQYNKIESGKYLTFPENTTLLLEAQTNDGYTFEGYSYGNPPTTVTDEKLTYTLTADDEIKLTFKENKIVPITVVLGKGHEALARSLCSEIEAEYGYSCSLNSDETELTVRKPGGSTIGRLMSFVSEAVSESKAISEDEEKSYYGTGLKALSQYSSYDDLEKEKDDEWEKVIPEEGLKVYVHWAKPAKTGILSIKTPVCGTTVKTVRKGEDFFYYEQEPKVKANASGSSELVPLDYYQKDAYMVRIFSDGITDVRMEDFSLPEKWYVGTVSGGERYRIGLPLYPIFGYYIDPDDPISVTVNDEKARVITFGYGSDSALIVLADVEAEHDWGDWEVTTEPTETKEGEETRICKHCGAKETRAIPNLTVEYRFTSGDGSVWTMGTTDKLRFVVKRNRADGTSIDHFKGLKVDGEKVPSSGYSAKSGSVVIDLMPAYLETLDEGDHILTAVFDDGNKETSASFTVEAASDNGDSGNGKSGNSKSPKTSDTEHPYLWVMLMFMAAASLACVAAARMRKSGRRRSE